jgi:hypothetical protein
MSYNELRTLSFRLASQNTVEQDTFNILKFPEAWKNELRSLQAEIKNRPVDQTNVPIGLLNKAMRALVPDLIHIAPKAAQSNDKSWLYSTTPIDSKALYLIVNAWVKTQFSKASETSITNLLKKLKPDDLLWQPTAIDVNEWTTEPNGTAKLGSDNTFILLPHILAAKLSQDNVTIHWHSEVLRFRRAPMLGTQSELVSWPPMKYKDSYWSVVITFTVQTVPFQNFPVIHCDLSVRRWGSLPIQSLPADKDTSVYLLTSVPWLEGIPNSNSFQVAPIAWERVPSSQQQECLSKYRMKWGSNLAPLLDKLQPRHPFPAPQDIANNPVSALNLNGSPSAALVYRNGINPEHRVGPGLSPADRRYLAEKIAELLAPEWEFVEQLQRVNFKSAVPQNPFLPNFQTKQKHTSIELQNQCCTAIEQTVGEQITVEIWYQQNDTKDALIKAMGECLGIPESASLPYKFPDSEFTLNISTQVLGALGDELKLDSGIKDKKEQRRQAIYQRGEEVQKEIQKKASRTSGVTVAFIELDTAENFSGNTDPKDAIRRGFALSQRLTQFISTEGTGNLPHRALNGFLDLLRQLGVQPAPPNIIIQLQKQRVDSKGKTKNIHQRYDFSEKLNYVGLWMIKQNSPTSADGSIQRVPVMVYMAANTTDIKAIAPGFQGWLTYREALLKIACGEAKGFKRVEEAIMRFVRPKLQEVTALGDTLLICHAQNLRSAWQWLNNGNITSDRVAFGRENPLDITRVDRNLRIVRVRDSQGHETPEWYAPKGDEQGWTKGLFKMGDRVFASTYNKPKQFQTPLNLSKVSSSTTTKGRELDASPHRYFWNPGLVELTVACIQPNDEIFPWAALTHELRHLALHYDEALKLPLPLHLAKQIEDYVLLLELDESTDT